MGPQVFEGSPVLQGTCRSWGGRGNWRGPQAFWGARQFWGAGNEALHELTTATPTELRIDLRTGRDSAFALYRDFAVGSAEERYRLRVGAFSGTAGARSGARGFPGALGNSVGPDGILDPWGFWGPLAGRGLWSPWRIWRSLVGFGVGFLGCFGTPGGIGVSGGFGGPWRR